MYTFSDKVAYNIWTQYIGRRLKYKLKYKVTKGFFNTEVYQWPWINKNTFFSQIITLLSFCSLKDTWFHIFSWVIFPNTICNSKFCLMESQFVTLFSQQNFNDDQIRKRLYSFKRTSILTVLTTTSTFSTTNVSHSLNRLIYRTMFSMHIFASFICNTFITHLCLIRHSQATNWKKNDYVRTWNK